MAIDNQQQLERANCGTGNKGDRANCGTGNKGGREKDRIAGQVIKGADYKIIGNSWRERNAGQAIKGEGQLRDR